MHRALYERRAPCRISKLSLLNTSIAFLIKQFKGKPWKLYKRHFSVSCYQIWSKKIFWIFLLLYWPRCRVLYKWNNCQLFCRALSRTSWKCNMRLRCSGHYMTIIWSKKYCMVIWTLAFMLAALPKCCQLCPIMASQNHVISSSKNIFIFHFFLNDITKMVRSSCLCQQK